MSRQDGTRRHLGTVPPDGSVTGTVRSLRPVTGAGCRWRRVWGMLVAGLLLPSFGLAAGRSGQLTWHVKNLRQIDRAELDGAPKVEQGVYPGAVIAVRSPRFEYRLSTTVQWEPAIEFVLENVGAPRVLRVFLTVRLKCHRGTLTRIVDHFVVDIDQGLDIGRTLPIEIPLAPYRSWGQLRVPADAFLEVVVDKVYGPKENSDHRRPDYTTY